MVARTDWRERTTLVIGCSGFVGRALTSRLCKSGARVIALGRNTKPTGALSLDGSSCRLTYVCGDISDRGVIQKVLEEFGIDTVFHLAAQSKVEIARQNPAETFEVNIKGTWNVLDAVRMTGRNINVLLASSDMVYGESAATPSTEIAPTRGRSPYAASKLCAELLADCYHQSFSVPVCIARTTNLYGGGDLNFERIVPSTIRAVMRGEAPLINSSGLPERDYLYIEDAIAGYLLLAEAMDDRAIRGETFNFSSGKAISVSTVVETILRLMQRTDLQPLILGRHSGEISIRHSSSAKAQEMLGWQPQTSLETGLKKTIEWYEAHAKEACVEAQN
ncbi:MAG TPA: SDR family NAD(P)-dependent oxidoreductase [Terriglobales bacterium]|nr:SDR family NAD(P)-dependent oxidoreductase [Terriglobales bacterium]